jgi:hypothetical protein
VTPILGGKYEAYYVGPTLADLFDPRPAERAAERMAEKGGDKLHDLVVGLTPIKTGNLATSWYRKPTLVTKSVRGTRYRSTVATDVDYAPYVNYGTGLWGPEHRKYLIEPHPPNQMLSWIDPLTGRRVFARRVWHPGSPGHHMVEEGTQFLGTMLNVTMASEMERFKGEMEAQAVRAQARARTHRWL